MTTAFRKPERKRVRLRMMIDGPAKAGKTVTALRFAYALGNKIAVIEAGELNNTEKYAGEQFDGKTWDDFDITQLPSFSPERYTEAIKDAARQGSEVIVIDSLSHAWVGKEGALQIADKPGLFGGWKTATPLHDAMFEAINNSPCHIIATCRSKMDYFVGVNEKGQPSPQRIGLAPIQRDTAPYEFDILVSVDAAHIATVSGSRCRAVEGASVLKPGAEFMQPIIQWLNTGVQTAAQVVSPLIGDVQIEKISQLLQKLRWGMDKIAKEFPKKYGVTSLVKLNQDQANDLIGWLEGQSKSKGRQAAAAPAAGQSPAASPPENGAAATPSAAPAPAAPTPAAPPAAATPPTAAQPASVPPPATAAPPAVATDQAGPVTYPQLERIRKLRDELFRVCKIDNTTEQTKEWEKILQKRAVTSARHLTAGQADQLISTLENKIKKIKESVNGQHPTTTPTAGGQPAAAPAGFSGAAGAAVPAAAAAEPATLKERF